MSPSVYPHPVAVRAFIICKGVCACTEMLWMCVLLFGETIRNMFGSAYYFVVECDGVVKCGWRCSI